MTRIAVFAGSFDPPTVGHLALVRRSLVLFDRVVVAVASNVRKATLFTADERVALLREAAGDEPRVEFAPLEGGLLVDFARARGACALVRGLRSAADFDYELPMAGMNRHLAPGIETVYLAAWPEHAFVSSSLVKEVASFGGDVEPFVPPCVLAPLRARLASRAASSAPTGK